LEKLIRDRTRAAEIGSANQKVSTVLDPLLAGLRSALKASTVERLPAEKTTEEPVDLVQSREAGNKLAKLLSEFDPGATDFIEVHQASLRPLLAGDAWPQFEKLVQSYSFADAQSRLEEALKKLPAA
jgi:hypothetical protein